MYLILVEECRTSTASDKKSMPKNSVKHTRTRTRARTHKPKNVVLAIEKWRMQEQKKAISLALDIE